MSKATLTYTLPEEFEEFYRAIHGVDLAISIWNVDQWLRDLSKYQGRIHVDIQEVRDRLRSETEGIDIW